MRYLKEVCEMIGKSEEDFVNEAVERELFPFLDSNKEFHLRPALLLPSEAEVVAERNAARWEEREERELPKEKCFVLDEVNMMGDKYYKIFSRGKIIKAPVECVELL